MRALEFKDFRARRKLGQNFLLDKEVARLEAGYARGKKAIEIGPGFGILTEELCASAKRVLAVEKDHRLYSALLDKHLDGNLNLVNSDFFKLDANATDGYDILVANVPYNLSSKTLMWVADRGIEAVLCLQKEFVEHMTAQAGSRKYSRLSVVTALTMNIEKIAEVGADSFYPKPRVDSIVVHITKRDFDLSSDDAGLISLIMEHKKKKLRNAVIDSSRKLGADREKLRKVSERLRMKDTRVFEMTPVEILGSARELAAGLRSLE